MSYLEDRLRNGSLTQQEHDELLALFNAARNAAIEYTTACWSGNDAEVEAAEDADDQAYRAVLVWLCAHTLPETGSTDTGSGVSS